MSSAILDLQKEITSPDCDIVNTLRKAHLIASKLKLSEFNQWISYELKGYKNKETIPNYRLIKGQLKFNNPFHGWVTAIIENKETEKMICETKIETSIPEIISLCSDSSKYLIVPFSGEYQKFLNEMCNSYSTLPCALHISRSSIVAIIENVKNTVLEWTLKLEEGILGEGMTFSDSEKENAKNIPQTINNYYGSTNVIHGSTKNIQMVSGNNNNVSFNYEEAKFLVDRIKHSIEDEKIINNDKDIALEFLSDIDDKIKNKNNPNIIKSVMIGLKDFLINAGANITAGLIVEKIPTIF